MNTSPVLTWYFYHLFAWSVAVPGQYLGFIFAESGNRHEVEQALTAARGQLRVVIQ